MMNRTRAYYGGLQENKQDRQYHKQYSSIMPVEIVQDTENNSTKFINYIGGDAYSAPIAQIKQVGGTSINEYHYLHRDYLGSILAITNITGAIKEETQFGAWGVVDNYKKAGVISEFSHNSLLGRGFTGHEHFFDVSLIHMNGRLYDPKLRRFLAPDNYIQDLGNTQNFNRYGYVLNNPLMYTDPSGESYECPECLTPEQQTAGGNLLASIINSLDGRDFRPYRNWIGNNFQSAVEDVVRPVREIGRWFRRLFGERQDTAPVEYSNYEGLSSDPLAGPSTNIPPAFFNGGGAISNLGVQRGDLHVSQKPNWNKISNKERILTTLEAMRSASGNGVEFIDLRKVFSDFPIYQSNMGNKGISANVNINGNEMVIEMDVAIYKDMRVSLKYTQDGQKGPFNLQNKKGYWNERKYTAHRGYYIRYPIYVLAFQVKQSSNFDKLKNYINSK